MPSFAAFGNDETKKTGVREAFEEVASHEIRRLIVEQGIRVDGRKVNEIRPISIETAYLPRAHGSALFTRGETQALVAATLGTRTGTVKSWLARGRRALAARLGEPEEVLS